MQVLHVPSPYYSSHPAPAAVSLAVPIGSCEVVFEGAWAVTISVWLKDV